MGAKAALFSASNPLRPERERRLVCSSPGGGGTKKKEGGGGGVGVTEGVAHRRAQRNGPPLAGTGTAARTVRGRVTPVTAG